MADSFLSDAEVDELCRPLKQPAAQVRYLRQVLKLSVSTKPNGRALLVRAHAERVLSGDFPEPGPSAAAEPHASQPQPNIDGFLKLVGGRRGAQKNVQPA